MGVAVEWMRDIAFGVLRKIAFEAADDLRSEDGENPEYDRALVEMCCRMLNLSTDEHRHTIMALLGIPQQPEHKSLVLNQRQQEAVGFALARMVESPESPPDDKGMGKELLAVHFPQWARSVRPDLPDTRRP